jgi:long-subunit acyl-CoA synthetase (AMP-forming)
MILRSAHPPAVCDRAVGDWVVRWAAAAPDRRFLAERAGDSWRAITYAETLDAVRRIGESLLARGLTPSTPVAILSDNSIDHALLTLGAMHAGIPVAPISPAYSLVSKDHAKLKAIFDLLRPGLVFAEDAARFAPALQAVGATATPIDALLERQPGARIDEAFASIGPDTVTKILFTSGSTGMPKGVINTQRMLCSNQQAFAQLWPLLEESPPVMCEWLPWNHTFGGNATFNIALRNGGTFYIDGGKRAPGLIETTARNLREVSPTLYFNVPRGFDLLLPFLESDEALRRSFLARLEIVFYAGAALPQNLWIYKIGDAMKLADPDDPGKGLLFDGRVAEDFKLQSGTWVRVGAVRLSLIAACSPLVQDAVITGHDREDVGALVFLNPTAVRTLGLDEAAVRTRLEGALVRLRAESTGSCAAPARLLVLAEPPSIDGNEITDKGYINQRAVLTRRAAQVDALHAGEPTAIVCTPV